MEPTILSCHHHARLAGAPPTYRKPAGETLMARRRRVVVLTERTSNISAAVVRTPAPATTREKTVYHDSWFDRLAINHLSQSVQAATGERNDKDGYEGLLESASAVLRKFSAEGQQELVILALNRAFPKAILGMIKFLMPPSKLSREYFAIFTTLFFPWLVGPCEVRKSDINGKRESNTVYIPKCRLLESSNCVGMCTNMCKLPSQRFIQDSLGMPVHMVPNFEDMSCEMIYGQHPPADDPALKQPCYRSLCIVKQTHQVSCSS